MRLCTEITMTLRLPVVVDFIKSTHHPICEDMSCDVWQKCAQHGSAGQFREESGFTPDLVLLKSGWGCTKQETDRSGMLVWRGGKYVQYRGPYEDWAEVDENSR